MQFCSCILSLALQNPGLQFSCFMEERQPSLCTQEFGSKHCVLTPVQRVSSFGMGMGRERPRGGCQGRGTPRKAEVPWAGWELPLLHWGRSSQRCVCGCSAPGEDRRKTGCAPAGFTSAGPGHSRAGQQQRNIPTFVFVSANCKNRSEMAEPQGLPWAGHGHVLRDAMERSTSGEGYVWQGGSNDHNQLGRSSPGRHTLPLFSAEALVPRQPSPLPSLRNVPWQTAEEPTHPDTARLLPAIPRAPSWGPPQPPGVLFVPKGVPSRKVPLGASCLSGPSSATPGPQHRGESSTR